MTLAVDDRVALRELVEAYAMAVDRLDAEWFGSLWTPDAVLAVYDATGEVRRWEGEEIGRMVAGVRRYLRTLHFVGNHRAWVEGSVVSGETSCFAHHLLESTDESGGRARDRVVVIRYDDEYARDATECRWRFARRDVRMLWRAHHDVELLGYEGMSEDLDVVVEHNADQLRYEAWVDGALAGFSEYRMRGDDTFVFTHTEVDEAFEGMGVASRLIRGALDDVREHGGSVIARCPFVATYIREHPAYADLLATP